MKIKCPYTYPHKSRKAKVDYITGIGGYYSRDGRFPIEFNVCACADLSFDNMWKHICEYYYVPHSPEETTLFKDACAKVHSEIEDNLWEWGQEAAARDLDPKWGDAYFMLWDGTRIDATLELHGRGGKHLVIAELEGVKLRGMAEDDLHDYLMAQSDNWGNEVVDAAKLKRGYDWNVHSDTINLMYRYVRQCEVDFTPEKAEASVESSAAYYVYSRALDEMERM